MNSVHPAAFYPELSDNSLRVIAVKHLDMRYSTVREMNSSFDDNYTRETAVFGRSRNMLIDMAPSSLGFRTGLMQSKGQHDGHDR